MISHSVRKNLLRKVNTFLHIKLHIIPNTNIPARAYKFSGDVFIGSPAATTLQA